MSLIFKDAVAVLRSAAEPTRLRMLAALARAELTVGEICVVLGQSQPRVSRHLKLLCDVGLVQRLREEQRVYYRAPREGQGHELAGELLALVAADDPVFRRDRERMERVMRERAQDAAREVRRSGEAGLDEAPDVDAAVLEEFGGGAVGALLDIGTGSGHLLKLLGARATRAVGIDISTDALRFARTNVHGAGLSHCEFQRGDMYALPFAAHSFDAVAMDGVLSDAGRPVAALGEAARLLRPDGKLLVIEDYEALEAAAVKHKRNALALLREWLARAGLDCERLRPVETGRGHWLLALGRRTRLEAAA